MKPVPVTAVRAHFKAFLNFNFLNSHINLKSDKNLIIQIEIKMENVKIFNRLMPTRGEIFLKQNPGYFF